MGVWWLLVGDAFMVEVDRELFDSLTNFLKSGLIIFKIKISRSLFSLLSKFFDRPFRQELGS